MRLVVDEHTELISDSPFDDNARTNDEISEKNSRFISRSFLIIISVLCLAALWTTAQHNPIKSSNSLLLSAEESTITDSTLPHIVYYLIDDQGYADMGYNSQDDDLKSFTPHIDKLAAAGLKLTSYYAEALCTPSRAALLTAKHPIHNGMNYQVLSADSPFGLPLHHKVMPEYFQDLGYKTHILGKWHLGFFNRQYLPTERGFDSHVGFYDGANYYYLHSVMVNSGWYTDFHRDGSNYEDTETYGPLVYMNEATSIIDQHDAEEPLFLLYSQQLVHKPLEDPHESMITDEQLSEAETIRDSYGDDRATFTKMSAALDHTFERLVEDLKAAGMYDNSIIIVSSDNGGCSNFGGNNYPLRGEKNTYFEGGVRTNAFIHSPLLPETLRGATYDKLFHTVDWLPTIVKGMLNQELPGSEHLDGINLWPDIMKEDDAPFRDELIHNIEVHTSSDTFRVAVRSGTLKLVYGEVMSSWYDNVAYSLDYNSCEWDADKYTTNVFMFDVVDDISESNNIYNIVSDEVIAEMWNKVDHYYGSMEPAAYRDKADLTAPFRIWSMNDHYIMPWVTDSQLGGIV